MAQLEDRSKTAFELGRLYAEKGDFREAIVNLTTASEGFYKEKRLDEYLNCLNLLLRIYAEQANHEFINKTKEKLQDLVLKESFELNAKTYYTLGICASYKSQCDVALDYFQKSLALALAVDNKVDISYAISGLAATYNKLGRLQEALKEIYNLKIFFEVLDVPDVKISSMLVNASILRKLKKFDESLEIMWECYELLSRQKNMFMFLCLLFMMGLVYKEMGDSNMARMYLRLAKKSIDPNNLKVLAAQVDRELESMGVPLEAEYDLVFDQEHNMIKERKKGSVDFKNQFILLDLLRMFMKNPGYVFTKEALVKNIWKQEYDPAVHDNKIYVTIKRLRKLIEPEVDKPKYIFRAKNGYYLSKGIRVFYEQ